MTEAMTSDRDEPLLAVRDLRTHFSINAGLLRAVNGVTFDLRSGQTLGIVGESGSGTVSYTHLTLPTKA